MTHPRRSVKPRLLVLTTTYPRWAGDPEPGFVHELARRLSTWFDVEVVGPGAAGALNEEELEGVRVHRFRYAPAHLQGLVNNGGITTNLRRSPWKYLLLPGFLFAMWFAIRAAIRRHRPDVIHAHWLLPQGLIAVLLRNTLRRRIPVVVTSHGADLYGWRGTVFRALKRLVVQRADKLVIVSRAMEEELASLGAKTECIALGPMGVDLRKRFTPVGATAKSGCEILFVGRLVEKKGLRNLIEAMPAIRAAVPAARLTIAGFGPEEPACKAMVKALALEDAVRFLGPVQQQDLPELYRRATVFAAPFVEAAGGDREGLGLVVVEAAACGCPVVVSNLPAVNDIFDASEAKFVPPGDIRLLAEAIVSILHEPSAAPKPSRATLIEKFDWESVAQNYRSILEFPRGFLP